MKKFLLLLLMMLCLEPICWGYETAPRIPDREIVERLTKLEEGQKAILREMDKRFESIDKRFESMDSRFDQLINIMIAIICAFAGIVAVTIGFAIWDRRTMIKRFEILESGERSSDADKLNRLIGAMKKPASGSPEIAEALKSFKLL